MSNGYQLESKKQHSGTDDVLLHNGTLTATTNGAAVDVRRSGLALTLSVTAASGSTPTLDVAVQTRRDASDAWRAVGTFAQRTGVASERKCFAGCDRQVRVVSTLGGTTPSFTFSVSGDSL